jgi:hypothetical protein
MEIYIPKGNRLPRERPIEPRSGDILIEKMLNLN